MTTNKFNLIKYRVSDTRWDLYMHISPSKPKSQRTLSKSKSRTSLVVRRDISSTSSQVALSRSQRNSRLRLSSMVLITLPSPSHAPRSTKFARSEERIWENSWMVSTSQRRLWPAQRMNDHFNEKFNHLPRDSYRCCAFVKQTWA
jgi:hypothetical protein